MSVPKYRHDLPQLKEEKLFLVDGGLETHLVFRKGMDLPCFASFTALQTEEGTALLKDYFTTFAQMAVDYKINYMFETPTWRASRDWGAKCGFTVQEIESINKKAVALLAQIRNEMEQKIGSTDSTKMVLSARLGPRGASFFPERTLIMTEAEAEEYHREQINWLAETEADMVLFLTASYCAEAIGAVRAAKKAGIPIAVSFTLETDGKLPIGTKLKDAIIEIDKATDKGPIYYMINCTHTTHFDHVLDEEGDWKTRLRGLQPNASRKSHTQLEGSTSLDEGDPVEFGQLIFKLKQKLPWVNILGGCCGTYLDHIESICKNVCSN